MVDNNVRVLTLPGWQGSGPQHWQTLWEQQYGYERVEQHDWQHPRRGDWQARLDEVVLSSERPVVLVAHSLGCLLVVAWAQFSRYTERVRGALLVAPPDVMQESLLHALPSWAPVPVQALPFPSTVVASRNDPYCTVSQAQRWANSWGSRWVDAGACGHVNAESGLGPWPAGHTLIEPWLRGGPSRLQE